VDFAKASDGPRLDCFAYTVSSVASAQTSALVEEMIQLLISFQVLELDQQHHHKGSLLFFPK